MRREQNEGIVPYMTNVFGGLPAPRIAYRAAISRFSRSGKAYSSWKTPLAAWS